MTISSKTRQPDDNDTTPASPAVTRMHARPSVPVGGGRLDPSARRIARVLVTLLTVAIAALTSMVSIASPASALTVSVSGSPGVLHFADKLAGKDYCTYVSGVGCVGYTPMIAGTGSTAYRSPAYAGRQIVTIDYQLWVPQNGTWVRYAGIQRRQGDIPTGYSAVNLSGVNMSAPVGYVSVDARVTWWRTDTMQRIGSASIAYNGNDYVCRTTGLRCATGTGWVWTN